MNLEQKLGATRLFSAAVFDQPEFAVPAAQALLAGGLDVMEVTFRHPHAADCVRHIREHAPQMTVGAGTLLTPAQIDEAIAAGATFGVSPGFNPNIVRHAAQRGLPFIPGVATPGEMEQAMELGCPLVKFFPAEAAGGLKYLRAVAAPYGHTKLRLLPLGGVNEHNLAEYLAIPLVLAVAGSWLTERALMRAGSWSEISSATRRALDLARQAR